MFSVPRLFRPEGLLALTRRAVRSSEISLIVLSVFVGVAAGLSAAALAFVAHGLQRLLFGLRPGELHLSAVTSVEPVRLLVLPLGGLVLALVLLATSRGKRTAIDVVEANALHGGRIPARDTGAVAAQTVVSNGFGASVGLEAAYAQVGGGIASIVGQWFNLRRGDLRTLVGAGSGAALGAAFGAPLTGAFYAFEIVIGAYTPAGIAPVAASALAAVVTVRTLGLPPYLIAASPGHTLTSIDYAIYALLGVIAAFAAIALMHFVSIVDRWVKALDLNDVVRPVVGGLILMPLAYVTPQALSSGHGALNLTIASQLSLAALAMIFVIKLCASAISLGFGFRGGLFFASLFLGTVLGEIFALVWAMIPGAPPLTPTDAALVGMAAMAVAVVGGPMTMSLLVLETTHDFGITAIVVTAALCSSALVRTQFGYSFSTWRLHLRGEVVRSARDIGWMRALTAERMMRRAPATIRDDETIAEFRDQFPLGSTKRVMLEDADGCYAGLVQTPSAFADARLDAPVSTLARYRECVLTPDMGIDDIMLRFDQSEADDLAVVDYQKHIVGMLSERYVRQRYAAEMNRVQRQIYGE
ncbi:MAG: chloride channel protein [Sphingomonadales bacterium]|nr:chloride channel protein [Sphingomonadales bacterium]MDE2568655.1 chloride channel protein [Sphingomonadales bacterium]